MVERICRACQAGNQVDATHCAVCGADLEAAAPLARRAPAASLAQRVRQSPILRSPAAKSVALGVVALAMDVGAALLSKRKSDAATSTAIVPASPAPSRAFLRRREWDEFDAAGNLRRRVVEHVLIRDE
jgi:hypothetical protein